MRHFSTLLALALAGLVNAQHTVSKDAAMVLQLDGASLSAKMSPKDIVKLEMMRELRKEIDHENPESVDLLSYGIDFKGDFFASMVDQDSVMYLQVSIPIKKSAPLINALSKHMTKESAGGVTLLHSRDAVVAIGKKDLVMVMPRLRYWFVDQYEGVQWDWGWNNTSAIEMEFKQAMEEAMEEAAEEAVEEVEEYDGEVIEVVDPESSEMSEEEMEKAMEELAKELEKALEELDVEGDMNENSLPSRDDWEMQKMYELGSRFAMDRMRGINSIEGLDKFKSFSKERFDAGGFMNYEKYWDMQRSEMGRGYGGRFFRNWYDHIAKTAMGMDVNMYLNFDKDQAKFSSHAVMDQEAKRRFEAMNDKKLNPELLKYLPQTTIGFMGMAMNVEKSYQEYIKMLIPEGGDEDAQLIRDIYDVVDIVVDEKAILNMIKGDGILALTDIKQQEKEYIDYELDTLTWEYKEVKGTRMETMPTFIMMAGVGSEENYHKIFRLIARMNKRHFSFQDGVLALEDRDINMEAFIRDGYLFVTNDPQYRTSLTAQGCPQNIYATHKDKVHHNMAMTFNFDRLFGKIPTEDMRVRDRHALKVALESLDKVELTTAEFQGNDFTTQVDLDLKGAGSNSFENLLNMFNRFFLEASR